MSTALATIDTQTGELVEGGPTGLPVPAGDPYQHAARVPITEEESAKLLADFADELWDVRPDDGMVYLPHVHLRRRLTAVFGVGQWALVPATQPMAQDDVVMQTWRLLIRGCFAAEATGDARYISNNAKMTYGDCLESAKSNALTRLCKALDIGAQAWDSSWRDAWCAKYVETYWQENRKTQKKEKRYKKRGGFAPYQPQAAPEPAQERQPQPEPTQAQAAPRPAPVRKAEAPDASALEWELIKAGSRVYCDQIKTGKSKGRTYYKVMDSERNYYTFWSQSEGAQVQEWLGQNRDVLVKAEPVQPPYKNRKVVEIKLADLGEQQSPMASDGLEDDLPGFEIDGSIPPPSDDDMPF